MRLVPLTAEHAAQMNAWMQIADIAENLGLRSIPSLEKTSAWIASALGDVTMQPFAVIDSNGETHLGNVIFDRIDSHLDSARLSIYIGAPGRGTGQAALRLALDWAFGKARLNKVWLTVHVKNARAIAAYIKAGFHIEGILRDEFILRGERLDALLMSILRRDFRESP